MSVISVGGRRYAADLYWLARGGPRATARAARRLGRPWFVHSGERTGFAADDLAGGAAGPDAARSGRAVSGPDGLHLAGSGPEGLHAEGVPALALALGALIAGDFWMALVEGDADTRAGDPSDDVDGEQRYALVKARGGAVLADGDRLLESRAAALDAFERARSQGWALHATPELAAVLGGAGSEVAAIDAAALGEAAGRAGDAIMLRRAAGGGESRLRPAAIGLALLAAITGGWLGWDAVVDRFAGPAPEAEPAAVRPDPEVAVTIDGAALIAACRRALIERPPFLPGWRIERIACAARFADPDLTGLRPELAGSAVLLVRWRLRPGHAEAVQRRVAETHLARWHAAQVADGRAWAVAPLGAVLRIAGGPAPPFLALRRAVDLAFGARGARIGYGRDGEGAWTVRIDDPGPLAPLAARAGGIDGLEITALARGAEGDWRLEGRPVQAERVAASRLPALGIGAAHVPGPGGGTQPDTEAGDEGKRHDDS